MNEIYFNRINQYLDINSIKFQQIFRDIYFVSPPPPVGSRLRSSWNRHPLKCDRRLPEYLHRPRSPPPGW